MSYPITVSVVSMGAEWRVVKSGSHHSKHRKKSTALEEAKRVAKGHDGHATLRIQGRDGRWQNTREYP
jgi:hypothetical protein